MLKYSAPLKASKQVGNHNEDTHPDIHIEFQRRLKLGGHWHLKWQAFLIKVNSFRLAF